MTDAEVFARIPKSVFKPWLEQQREAQYKILSHNPDPKVLSRAQGAVQLIEKMLSLLDKQ